MKVPNEKQLREEKKFQHYARTASILIMSIGLVFLLVGYLLEYVRVLKGRRLKIYQGLEMERDLKRVKRGKFTLLNN